MKNNLKVAKITLETVELEMMGRDEYKKLDRECWVECFDNGREQGYVIKTRTDFPSFNVAFSENRNSDDIVVYCYRKTGFPSNLPDEDSWEDKKCFGYGQYYEAACYIIQRLKEAIAADKKLKK